MKDEIKEILEDIKRHLDYVEETKQASIRDNEMKAMYDYITNLQEENERLRKELEKYIDVINFKVKQFSIKEVNKLQERIDKAIKILKNHNDEHLGAIHDTLKILKGEDYE